MTGKNLASFREWTHNEVRTATALLRNLTGEGYSGKYAFEAIAARIGRTPGAVRCRFYILKGFEGKIPYVPKPKVPLPRQLSAHDFIPVSHGAPAHVLAERERRLEALDLRDLTARFNGDPPPGFSALDRRR